MFADQKQNKKISYLKENSRNILITEFRLNVDEIQMIFLDLINIKCLFWKYFQSKDELWMFNFTVFMRNILKNFASRYLLTESNDGPNDPACTIGPVTVRTVNESWRGGV